MVCEGKETKGQGDINLALDVVCEGKETKDQEGITSAVDDVVLRRSKTESDTYQFNI